MGKITGFLWLVLFLALAGQAMGQNERAELEQAERALRVMCTKGDFHKAGAEITRVRERAKALQMWPIYCSTLLLESVGVAYTGEYDKELGLLERALGETERHLGRKHLLHGEAQLYIARYYDDVEGRTDIDSLFEGALAIAKDTLGEECMVYALALNSYGMYKHKSGDKSAEEMLWKSLDLLHKVDTIKEDYAAALNNMAIYLAQEGRYKEAERYFLQAIAIHEGISGENYSNKSLDLQNLGTFYSYVKDYRKSEQYYLASIAIDSANFGIAHPNCKLTRGNLMAVYVQTAKFKQVVALGEDLLDDEMPQSELLLVQEQVFPWLAAGYRGLGRFAEAETVARKNLGLQIGRCGYRHNKTARAYCDLAQVFSEKMEIDSACKYAELGLQANAVQDFGAADLQREGYALFGRLDYQNRVTAGRIFHAFQGALLRAYQREPSEANKKRLLELSEAALSYQERVRLRLTDEDNQLSILASKQLLIGAVLTVLTAGQNLEEQSRAFELVEQNKAIVLAAALQNNQQRASANIPDSLLQQEKTLKTDISTLQAKWLESPEQDKKKITNQLAQANLDLEALQQRIRALDTAYYNQLYAPKTLSLKAAQAILPADALLLEYFISDTDIFLFAASPNAFKAYKTPIKEHEFKTQIDSLRFLMSDMRTLVEDPEACLKAYAQLGHELYALLLQQALADFPDAQKLIVIPDQQLWNIPFEALLTQAPSGLTAFKDLPYLLQKYEVSYAYSATLLGENQAAASRLDAAPKKAMLLAADYSLPNPNTDNPNKKNALRRALAPLPAAQKEVVNIAEILNTSHLDAHSHGEAAFKQQAADYNIIHLAMHGIIDQKHPELSALAFSELGDPDEDNFLQAHEIAKLRLRARLVVLSACETGVGRLDQGEGAMSLGRSFMYAGVPSLVISLWPVNDAATASLMHDFYLSIDQNAPPAQALRQAKIGYIERSQGIANHPAFWAAFVHLGDNQPVNAAQSNWLWWAVGISVALAALALALYFKPKSR